MSECMNADVRDALPDLLNGRLSALDTVTMTAHLESCADCRAELALLRQVRDARELVPRMNAPRIAAAIPSYGGNPVGPDAGTGRQWMPRSWVMRVAAVAVLATSAAWLLSDKGPGGSNIAVSERPDAYQTVALTPRESVALQQAQSGIANAIPATVKSASLSLVGGTADLSDADLEQLVAELEGMEALPSTDPQSVTLTVEDMETDQ